MAPPRPVILWHNAGIITMDPDSPRAEAMVTAGEIIVYRGSFEKARKAAVEKGRKTSGYEAVDLGGRTVVPGFNDNHVHTVMFGEHLLQPDLSGMDREEIVRTVKERYSVDSTAGGTGGLLRCLATRFFGRRTPIVGYGWDYPSCPDPDKEFLDRHFPDRPVMLVQFSGHGQWLNSNALKVLGIKKGSKDPAEGYIERREDGEPTGIIREMVTNKLVMRHILKIHFNRRRREDRLRRALDEYKKLGITSVQDNTWFFPTVFSLNRLRRRGELTCRFSCWAYILKWWSPFLMGLPRYDRHWVRRGLLKHFLDGTFSTKSAWLWEPYADEPDNYGTGTPAPRIEQMLTPLARKNKQGAFHVIGDRTVSEFLDAYERVISRYPGLQFLRIRLEHVQLIRPEDIRRAAELGVLIASQPPAMTTPEKDRNLLGERRLQKAYPYRTLLDAGVHLSFGSDIPGESFCNPIRAIHLAVNRDPGQNSITAEEALRCYTVESAYAEFAEEEKGLLRQRMPADFVVLSEDPTTVPPERIKDITVEMTVVGGKVVYTNTH
jgi:predicted amidohydrolase YtcJ